MSAEDIYLDHNSTTPLWPSVVQVISESLQNAWGNPSSSYGSGVIAKEQVELARRQVGGMIGAPAEGTHPMRM